MNERMSIIQFAFYGMSINIFFQQKESVESDDGHKMNYKICILRILLYLLDNLDRHMAKAGDILKLHRLLVSKTYFLYCSLFPATSK